MVKIRPATENDIPRLVAMAAAMHAEAPRYRDVPFVAGDQTIFLEMSLKNPDHIILVAVDDDKIVGMLGALLVPFMFNLKERYAADFGFYVDPGTRGKRAAVLLVMAYEGWAQAMRVKRACLSESSGIAPDKVGEFLRGMGYSLSGSSYAKEL